MMPSRRRRRPGLVLVLDLAADRRHGGLGDRGLVAERLGEGGLDVADRQAAHERGDHQRLQRVGLGHVRCRTAGTRTPRLVPRSFGRASCTGPAVVLTVTSRYPFRDPGRASLAGRGPLVAVAAEELGDLGLQRGLHQQLRAEPGDLLQDLRQLLVPRRIARRCGRGCGR